MSAVSKRVQLALRLAVSAGLVLLLVSRLDTENMARFVRRADLLLVLITFLAVLVDRGLMAGRWVVLVEALDVRAPRLRILKIFFLSTFFGSFLPSGVGGEAVRALSFGKLTSRGVESVASVVMDRLLGLLSMLLAGLLSLSVFYHVYPHPALLGIVIASSLLVVAVLALSLSPRVHTRALSWHSSPWLTQGVGALARYRNRMWVLVLVLGMSLAVQLLRIVQAYLLSEAMGLGTEAIYFFCFIPPILIVTMLPVSIGGWGTANLAYVALFSQVGMDPEGAFVLSVLILALGVLGNLPGGLIYAWEGFAAAEPREKPGSSRA
ncbi:MAG TPA: lysylphosphatidylglycerol synthase transmembrane domain-containing protein [Vicinamibacteria bacterium]|nr:lysylphosphatidylglycerol synthase transmembrane domain-containing protein [Vicinamibacteria bacterium]